MWLKSLMLKFAERHFLSLRAPDLKSEEQSQLTGHIIQNIKPLKDTFVLAQHQLRTEEKPVAAEGIPAAEPAASDEGATNKEAAIVEHIKKYGKTLSNFLSEILSKPFEGSQKHQFVLIGETHLKNESTSSTFVNSLPKLKKEVHGRNENLIIAVEIINPNLIATLKSVSDYSKSDDEIYIKIAHECTQRDLRDNNIQDQKLAKDLTKSLAQLLKQEDSILKVYIAAKRNGIPVVCPDERRNGWNDVSSQSEQRAMENITRNLSSNTRVICYGGSLHASKLAVTVNNKPSPIKTLGMWLSEKYGDKSVISIRTANYSRGFDARPIKTSDAPRVDEFMSNHSFRNPIIAPCIGILDFNGNKNPYNYFHDYVFIDPAQKQ